MSIPKQKIDSIATAVLETALQNKDGIITTVAFDEIIIEAGILPDPGSPFDKATEAWANRIAVRNRVRAKLNAVGAKAGTPWRLIMEQFPKPNDPADLGSMRLHVSGQMMGTVVEKRAKKTTGYAKETGKVADRFIRHHPGEIDPFVRAQLTFSKLGAEAIAEVSQKLHDALHTSIEGLKTAHNFGVATLADLSDSMQQPKD